MTDFVNCLYDYGLNWISLGPITRINLKVCQIIEPGITQCWVIGVSRPSPTRQQGCCATPQMAKFFKLQNSI